MNDEALIADARTAADAAVEAAFPEARLARQRARILQRIVDDGRPGQVIAFPGSAAPLRPSLMRTSSTTRWVAAAAVSAFVIGLLAGQHLPRDLRSAGSLTMPAAIRTPEGPVTPALAMAPALVPSDEQFLVEIDAAVGSGGPAVLRRIDAVTPHSWEVPVARLAHAR